MQSTVPHSVQDTAGRVYWIRSWASEPFGQFFGEMGKSQITKNNSEDESRVKVDYDVF